MKTPSLIWIAATCGMAALVLTGCGSGLPPKSNPDEARQALQVCLEAWQKGETSEALAGRKPAVYFNEIRDRPEWKLKSFSIAEDHETYGQSVRLSAQLTILTSDGETFQKKMHFLIDTAPAIVIVPG